MTVRRGLFSESLLRTFVAVAITVFLSSPSVAATKQANVFRSVGGDFSAFYCSGEVAAANANPYLVEPLRKCENRVQPSPNRSNGVVTPSPLPGYDLAMFATLARLPYELAKVVWYLMLLISIGVAAFCLTRLTGFSPFFILLVIIPVDGFLNLSFGQVPPVVVAALSLAAYLVERRRYVAATFAAAITLIEPHIGAPACFAMFMFLPGCRLAFGALAIVLTGAALSVGGPSQNLAYFTTHLPAQARSELVAGDQFSLSAVLHLLRVPDGAALALGTISYLTMASLGIYLGRYAARSFSAQSFIVVLPAAAVLFGGAYIHDVQFAAALPAALLLCAKQQGRLTPWVALGLLSVPWFTFATGGYSTGLLVRVVCMVAIGWIAIMAVKQRSIRRTVAVGAAVASFLIVLAIATVLPHRASSNSTAIAPAFLAANASAQDNWGAYLRATPSLSRTSAREEFEKLPFWLGLISLLFIASDARIKVTEASGRPPQASARKTLDRGLRRPLAADGHLES